MMENILVILAEYSISQKGTTWLPLVRGLRLGLCHSMLHLFRHLCKHIL